jgi:hypothetical protein
MTGLLTDAKARLGELVRRARSEGPTTRDGARVRRGVAAEEFHRLKGDRTGQALVAALQSSPCRDIEIEPKRERPPVRSVKL